MAKAKKEPLFHIVKRDAIPLGKAIGVRAITILIAVIVCGIIFLLLAKESPFEFYKSMFDGGFGTTRRVWQLFYAVAQLLLVALAVTPAFKMKFWNIGAEGQILVSGLACAAVMVNLGEKVPLPLLWCLMTVAAVVSGIIWAVIPAIFKAIWNTNETLFTLMMNYIATFLVTYCINIWVKSGSGTLAPMFDYAMPTIVNKWLLNIIIITVITALVYIYLRFSKQGYEIAVVGESQNTARYIGINVKKVIIRTMILSGALCGIAGLVFVGAQDYTISTQTAGGLGFTAIMVSWLGKFNPLFMILTSFLIAFLKKGAGQVSTDFGINTSISEIITAVMLFFIIGCEFFINYKIVFRNSKKEVK
jgi:simple sugar transport system permease protein